MRSEPESSKSQILHTSPKPSMRLYNTLTRSEEPFEPSTDSTVRMYTCGLTVYARGHIGNFRTFVCIDVLRRTLRYLLGYRMRQVMNFTDVDDRTIAGALKAGTDLRTYTEQYIAAFREDAKLLGLEDVEEMPRATDEANLRAMADLIRRARKKRAHVPGRWVDLLQNLDSAHLWRAGAAGPRRAETRCPSGQRQLHERGRARLRAVESQQGWRAVVGPGRSARPSGLAPRVFGDGAPAAR